MFSTLLFLFASNLLNVRFYSSQDIHSSLPIDSNNEMQNHKKFFSASDFRVPLYDCSEKMPVITGPSGMGKTQFALAHFKNPLLVTTLKDLCSYTKENDGIVFDDFEWKALDIKQVLALTDYEETKITVGNKTIVLPKGLPRIATSRDEDPFGFNSRKTLKH